MAFGTGELSITLEDILAKTTEFEILDYYFMVDELPIVINSPLREDNKPSFGLYTLDDKKVHYYDFSTKDKGGLFDLLMKYWGESYKATLMRVWEDLPNFSNTNVKLNNTIKKKTYQSLKSRNIDLQCKVREWRDYDLDYWASYGISLEWLKYADIYPISHKIVIRDNQRYVFGADKYAYAYVERKEGKVTLKIYQPFNKGGYKWSNRHDRSVISLWTKVPEFGDRICICSSMKDALCLWANTGIPSLAIQGEGYGMSDAAINELKRRYKHIYILLDNDEAGLLDAEKLAQTTGFTNIVLPQFNGGKDVSDLFKSLQDPNKFKNMVLDLFKDKD
jgi:hypothetical protein